jgi:glycosyltransferase involved in cell wall biosynthesis
LNEYGFHLAKELQQDPLLSLSVLADEYDGGGEEHPDFDVVRCWRPNSFSNPARILRAVRELKPDIVWFNSVFSSFGTHPAPAFVGLCAPAVVRAAGYSTHITLHHLMEGINLADAGVRHPLLYHMGGAVATRLLLLANSVTVLLPAYRRTLIQKYKGRNVHLRAHGVFAGTPQYPDFSQRDNPEQRILAFGKWGTYKRLEILIEAFERVANELPNARLIIAGENHPSAPGYVESIAETVKDNPQVTVRGYVREEDIPELFNTASVLVMPYSSSTGSSGVAHQACQFGVPILCADLADFYDMAAEEQIAMEYYERGDSGNLADKLIGVLQDGERRREMAERNFHAAMRMTMPQVIRQYVRAFDWHKAARSASQSRFARIRQLEPSWTRIAGASIIVPPTPAVVPLMATATSTVSDSETRLAPTLVSSTTPGHISPHSIRGVRSVHAPSTGKRRPLRVAGEEAA